MSGIKSAPPKHSLAHHALFAGLCAVLTFLPIHLMRNTTLIGGASDAALDLVMRLQADSAHESRGPGITLVDFGEEEYAMLGRPTVLPRDRLATMLERIAQTGPALIVLDVDISWPDAPEHEAAMKASLARLSSAAGAPIFLVREGLPGSILSAPPYFRPTLYDSVVTRESGIHWVSAALPWENAFRGGVSLLD